MAFTHETESAFQKGQISAAETTWGTAVTPTIEISSVTLNPAIKRATNKFTARGNLLPTVRTLGREWTEIGFEGMATYQELGYFVGSIDGDTQIDPTSRTVQAGGLRMTGCVVTGFTLKGNRDEVTLSGSMIGKKGAVTSPASLSPIAQEPLTAANAVITVNSVTLDKVFEWELAVSDLWGAAFFVGDSEPANVLQKAISASFKLKAEWDSQSQTILGYGNATEAVTVTITDGSKSVAISFDAAFGEPEQFSDEDGVYAIGLNADVMNDTTTAITITIDNT